MTEVAERWSCPFCDAPLIDHPKPECTRLERGGVKYPTPWTATAHTMSYGRWYAGVIERRLDRYRNNSKRCAHHHKRRDLALRCAEKMLSQEASP